MVGICDRRVIAGGRMMASLMLLILALSGVHCDGHSLRGYETVVSSPASGLPIYSVVVYVDDKMLGNYTSETQKYLPKVEWIKQLEAEYWERETQRSRKTQQIYEHHLQTLMNRFNQTRGFHSYQWMYGCELRDDGSTATYMQDGYDGRDFMYLDTKRGIYIPTMSEAQITTQRWNSPEQRQGERHKFYLETVCMAYLKKFISYGRKELERRVLPEVKVWSQSDRETRLHCLVYGFHPRAVEVKWMRNGTDHMISNEASPILPHPDGTYQIRISVEVPTSEEDSYSCHVDHVSLEEPLILIWYGHSLRSYETATSSPASGLPSYSVVRYVDDKMIVSYTSDTQQYLPKVEWMKKFEAEYWQRETERTREDQYIYMNRLQMVMSHFNETKGVHFYQVMYGCELREDGSTVTYAQEGYDGKDYMYLDTQRGVYVPAMSEAQITTQLLNSPEISLGEENKNDLQTLCIEYLKRFIGYGKEEFEKRVRPEVKVWGHQKDGVTTLHCLAYGFHPRAVEVTWVRNGEDHMISLEAKTILPHPDGTYQTRTSVEVPTREGDSYSCHVDHSSLEKPLICIWGWECLEVIKLLLLYVPLRWNSYSAMRCIILDYVAHCERRNIKNLEMDLKT
ncbi:uncharacterized protein PAF06_020108 [Gastrophryne carolinensis]